MGCCATGEIGQPEMSFKGILLQIPYGVDVVFHFIKKMAKFSPKNEVAVLSKIEIKKV